MDLKNGYKVIYEIIENREDAGKTRVFKASKTGKLIDAETIAEAKIGEYKLIYEKDGSFYGSVTGIPSEEDYCFTEFDTIFKEEAVEEVEPDSIDTEGEVDNTQTPEDTETGSDEEETNSNSELEDESETGTDPESDPEAE